MNKKILVIGGAGQLGSDIVKVFRGYGQEVFAPTHLDLPIEAICTMNVHEYLTEHRPDLVINCAAIHDLNVCEKNPEMAFLVNSTAQLRLTENCIFFEIPLIYISTNYVFDGERTRFYDTDDVPNPVQVYGESKLVGEIFTRMHKYGHIIRTSGLFGITPPRGKTMNFVDRVISHLEENKKMHVKDWEFISPTYTHDLAEAIFKLSFQGKPPAKITHIVNNGVFTWWNFAKNIALFYDAQKADLIIPNSKIVEEHPARPKGAMLNSTVEMPTVANALERYLKEKYGKEVEYGYSHSNRSEGASG